MADLENLGRMGYEKQLCGAYDEAIAIYSMAIKKYPRDARLYNNRCLCYSQLKEYKMAMKDADYMVCMFPLNKKSYYRKAEILFKLEKFEKAEQFFRMVLNMDPWCEEAKFHAREAQISQICKGLNFSREEALQALNFTGNVQDAREALMNGKIKERLKSLEDIIYVSGDEDESSPSEIDPLQDPRNPYCSDSLWIGRIPKGVSEPYLRNLFSKYGKLRSVRCMSHNDRRLGYAFINYSDTKSPGKAMRDLQGVVVRGERLMIRYPRRVLPPGTTRNSTKKMK